MYGTQGGRGHCSGVSPLWLLIHNTMAGTHTYTHNQTVAEGGGIEETIKYICPSCPSPPPSFSTRVEIEHFSKDYWLGTQEAGGKQQMRPHHAAAPAVWGLGLHSGWPGGSGFRAEVGGVKAECVNLRAWGHRGGGQGKTFKRTHWGSKITDWGRSRPGVICVSSLKQTASSSKSNQAFLKVY